MRCLKCSNAIDWEPTATTPTEIFCYICDDCFLCSKCYHFCQEPEFERLYQTHVKDEHGSVELV